MTAVELAWRRVVRASVPETWDVLRDTDGFNRHAGFGFTFEREGSTVTGHSTLGGIRSTWDELPMQYLAPRWFESRRRMHDGPVAQVLTRCELTASPEGTEVHYRLALEPRSRWARPAVAALAHLVVRKQVGRGLEAVEAALRGERTWFATPPLLHAAQHRRLQAGLDALEGPTVEVLRDRLLHAPLTTQYALRPRQVAAQEGLSVDEVALGFVRAVGVGLLCLEWVLICPRCRGASEALQRLMERPDRPHCESCGITYDGALADHVEARFRVHPELRSDPIDVYCAVSPSRTPHVLAQLEVPAAEVASLTVPLATGAYRVEVGDEAVLVEVTEGGPPLPLLMRCAAAGTRPRRLVTGPGEVSLTVVSTRGEPVDLMVRERWQPPFLMSAASLLAVEGVAELLPPQQLGEGLTTELRHGWVVVVAGDTDHLDRALGQIRGAAVVERRRAHVAVLLLDDAAAVLSAAEACAFAGRQLSAGVAVGPVLVLREGGGAAQLGGRAVDAATERVERVGRPRIVVDPEVLRHDAFAGALEERGSQVVCRGRADGSALLVFASLFAMEAVGGTSGSTMVEDGADDEPLPERVGPYLVLREIDRGGMGMVLECVGDDGVRVAVKVMLPAFASLDALQQRFFNEAWYTSRIDDPHVVRVLDFGLDGERPWLAMECLTGETLSARLERSGGRLPLAQAWAVMAPVLRGLQALHTAGLVHRDLKPANVFLVNQPRGAAPLVKLLDFGLVRRAGIRRDEGLAGTPDYMAPEQLLGDPSGPQVDVFAAAVLFVRLVIGRTPFEGRSGPERAIARVRDDELAVDLSLFGEAEPVLQQALAAEVAERPVDAEALREALEQVL